MATLSRRDWMKLTAAGWSATAVSGVGRLLADTVAASPTKPPKHCILLWMAGGPSQLDTFDPKPGHENGGEFSAISTAVPGIQVCEHLPEVARRADHLAIVRSMSTKEGDHGRATYLAHTGNRPQGAIRYPTLGSLLSKEMSDDQRDLPPFVSIAPLRALSSEAFGPGFLGPRYAPLIVAEQNFAAPSDEENIDDALTVRNLQGPEGVTQSRMAARLEMLSQLESRFAKQRPDTTVLSHQTAYEKAVRMMSGKASDAFDLDTEPDELRDRYGRTQFGQGCLLARRLLERGVSFVEVALNGGAGNIGWDTHQDNFNGVKTMCGLLDPAWATLLDDLSDRGMLESTLIIWMGEFGRTPRIVEDRTGRDHFPDAWSTVLAGAGVRGGQVYGQTSPDGMEVMDLKVSMPDFLATVCKALEIDPLTQNMSNIGRPLPLVESSAVPIDAILL